MRDVFELIVTPPSPPTSSPSRFHPIHARLSNGSLAESTFVFVNPSAVERDLPRSLYLTTPYPIRPGSEALFGAVLANGGEAINVTSLDLEIPGGYDLLHHNGTGVPLFTKDFNVSDPLGGNWTRVDDRHVRWQGSRPIDALDASYWSVSIPVTDNPAHFTAREGPRSAGPSSTLEFENGFRSVSTRWGSVPGVVQHRVPPASENGAAIDGYPWHLGELLPGAVHPFEAAVTSPRAHLENASSYRVAAQSSNLQHLQSSVANSSFAVHSRLVPIGTYARVDGNLESLLTTVSQTGATDMALTLDMYAPISGGCAPTTSATIAVSGLPANPVATSLVWDGGAGTPSVFAVTEDRVVHRVGATGLPLWSAKLDAMPLRLAPGRLVDGTAVLLVGDDKGRVHRLDPNTGGLAWSTTLALGAGAGTNADRIVALSGDANTGVVLAATAGGALALLEPGDGAALASRLTLGESYVAAAYGPGETVLALSATGLQRFGPGLVPREHSAFAGDSLGLAVGASHALVSTRFEALVFDVGTLEVQRRILYSADASLATAGDATGDGVDDLLVALSSSELLLFDGATGNLRWSYDAGDLDHRVEISFVPPPAVVGRSLDIVSLCSDAPLTYQSDARCVPSYASRRPLGLAAGSGYATALVELRGLPYLVTLAPSGTEALVKQLSPLRTYTHVAQGGWAAGVAISTGDVEGLLSVYSTHGALLASSTPSDRVGSFSYYMPIPEGGFFGTHLVVATLRWTDPSGVAQEARLFDWFEVVGPDGRPVLHPVYRVVLVVQDRGNPLAGHALPASPLQGE